VNKKLLKKTGLLVFAGLAAAAGVGIYMFNMPHRDVQAATADYEITASALVEEYLANAADANEKYLSEEGESKILVVSGTVLAVREDMNQQQVVLLKEQGMEAGVSCTFTRETSVHADALVPGQVVTIKGVIRSGAGYDEDLDLYEDVILEKCDLFNR